MRDGDRARITFVVLDGGVVADVQEQTIQTHGSTLQINGQMVDLGSCPTTSL